MRVKTLDEHSPGTNAGEATTLTKVHRLVRIGVCGGSVDEPLSLKTQPAHTHAYPHPRRRTHTRWFPKRDRHSPTIWWYLVNSVSIPDQFSLNSLSFPGRIHWNPVSTDFPQERPAFARRSSLFGLSSDQLLSRTMEMAVSCARIRDHWVARKSVWKSIYCLFSIPLESCSILTLWESRQPSVGPERGRNNVSFGSSIASKGVI